MAGNQTQGSCVMNALRLAIHPKQPPSTPLALLYYARCCAITPIVKVRCKKRCFYKLALGLRLGAIKVFYKLALGLGLGAEKVFIYSLWG